MASYYIDYEFHEHIIHKGLFHKQSYHTIEPISVAIVCEDGRELDLLYNDFDITSAWNNEWLRNNVLVKIFYDYESTLGEVFDLHAFKKCIKKEGVNKKQASLLIKEFCQKLEPDVLTGQAHYRTRPTFYGWYSAYDHVALANTFGTMMDFPTSAGFPMYTNDLQQDYDNLIHDLFKANVPLVKIDNDTKQNLVRKYSYEAYDNALKNHRKYPRQVNEHLAIHDARFNQELHKFINNVRENVLYKKS